MYCALKGHEKVCDICTDTLIYIILLFVFQNDMSCERDLVTKVIRREFSKDYRPMTDRTESEALSHKLVHQIEDVLVQSLELGFKSIKGLLGKTFG